MFLVLHCFLGHLWSTTHIEYNEVEKGTQRKNYLIILLMITL